MRISDWSSDVCSSDLFVELTGHNGIVVYGRSDATLNPGGVRIGTAEIYREVEKLDAVEEAIVIGQDWEGDVRVVLFVKLRLGRVLDDDLVARIHQQIRTGWKIGRTSGRERVCKNI